MRLALAERAIKMNLSVRALERLAEGTGEHRRRATIPHPLSADERDFETRLRERFGTHVALVRQGRGGRIELRFASEDELLRLGDSLLGED